MGSIEEISSWLSLCKVVWACACEREPGISPAEIRRVPKLLCLEYCSTVVCFHFHINEHILEHTIACIPRGDFAGLECVLSR